MRPIAAALALLLAANAPLLQAAAPAFQPMDVFALQWADHPVLSPDGKQIVYERGFFDTMKDQRRSNLWLIDVASGAQRPLTTGGRARRPGRLVAGRPAHRVRGHGRRQGADLRALGRERRDRAPHAAAAGAPATWPGRRTAAGSHSPSFVKAQAKPLAENMPSPPEGATWAPPVKVIDKLNYRAGRRGLPRSGVHAHVRGLVRGRSRRASSRSGEHNFDGSPVWTPDGKALYVTGQPRPGLGVPARSRASCTGSRSRAASPSA
jgi:acylaminoacyl-peptidase